MLAFQSVGFKEDCNCSSSYVKWSMIRNQLAFVLNRRSHFKWTWANVANTNYTSCHTFKKVTLFFLWTHLDSRKGYESHQTLRPRRKRKVSVYVCCTCNVTRQIQIRKDKEKTGKGNLKLRMKFRTEHLFSWAFSTVVSVTQKWNHFVGLQLKQQSRDKNILWCGWTVLVQ